MKETKKKEDRIARIKQFWQQTKGQKRKEFLFHISKEDITERMMYRYMQYDKIPSYKIRSLERCIDEYRVTETENKIEERT